MGYRIEYDRGNGKYEITPTHPWRASLIFLGALGVFLVYASVLRPETVQFLRSVLIPGEDAVTVQAFQNMTDDLRCGASVSDAVEAFCRYVIHGR